MKKGRPKIIYFRNILLFFGLVTFLAGKDVASADKAGGNSVENNWWWTLDAYHYGKIYAEEGKQGVIEEIKEHPVEAALAASGLGFIGRIGKGAKAVGKLAKVEKLEQKAKNIPGIGKYKDVGGHHPIQKAAFEGHPKYNAQEVLAVSEEVRYWYF